MQIVRDRPRPAGLWVRIARTRNGTAGQASDMRDETTHGEIYYLASEVDGRLQASAAISSAGRQQRMQAAFEAKYQRDWNDPAGDEMKAVWSDAWAAANAGMPS